MITRRTLLKLLALFPLVGPTIAKAMVKSDFKPALFNGPYLPAYFPKWDRTMDGLAEAGRWAIEIERSRLPSDMVFPRVGQVWETLRECEVALRPRFASNQRQVGATGSARRAAVPLRFMLPGAAWLQDGEGIRILGLDDDEKPLQVSFQPIRYAELEAGVVPHDIRLTPGYVGYELSAKTVKSIADFGKDACQTYFNEAFRLVEDVK